MNKELINRIETLCKEFEKESYETFVTVRQGHKILVIAIKLHTRQDVNDITEALKEARSVE